MMHDQEKLSRLFDAALKEEDSPQVSQDNIPSAGQPWQFVRQGQVAEPVAAAPAEPASAFRFVRPGTSESPSAPNYGESSEEFAQIIDRKILLRRQRNRRSFLVTLILFSAGTLGGAGWFVSSPTRVAAFKAALSDIRSVTDIAAIRAKYQKSLDKIAERRNHINDASAAMGVDPNSASAKEDAYMDDEMRQMMGSDGGPTVGERSRKLGAKYDEMKKAGLIKDEATNAAAP